MKDTYIPRQNRAEIKSHNKKGDFDGFDMKMKKKWKQMANVKKGYLKYITNSNKNFNYTRFIIRFNLLF